MTLDTRVDRYVMIARTVLGGEQLDRRQLIANGRTNCRALETRTKTYPQLLTYIAGRLGQAGVSADRVRVFVDASIAAFCPGQHP